MRYTALSLASSAHTTPQKKAKISQYLSSGTWSTFGEILREFEFFCSTFAKYDNFWNKIVDMPLKEVGHRESPARIIPRMLPWDFRKDFVKKSLDLVTKPLTSYFLRHKADNMELLRFLSFWMVAKPLNNHKLVSSLSNSLHITASNEIQPRQESICNFFTIYSDSKLRTSITCLPGTHFM